MAFFCQPQLTDESEVYGLQAATMNSAEWRGVALPGRACKHAATVLRIFYFFLLVPSLPCKPNELFYSDTYFPSRLASSSSVLRWLGCTILYSIDTAVHRPGGLHSL